MTKFAERMRKAMETSGMKQIDVVRRTGIDKSTISHYLKGDYKPKGLNLEKLAEVLDVNDAWLDGYDAPMERTHYGDTLVINFGRELEPWEQEYYDQDLPIRFKDEEVTREELNIITAYRDADPAIKAAVRKILDVEDL